ncbi:WXG100 family type VII secretion target [Thermostaphylospora chromogena]|uniref:Uncharacterized conserved protein YukE n=1 Tax=Thermostaphylospora chromogena TaxID=35622 RepID=A0A1H1AT06_9ACTN|nr:WXG100 family type VII secretion target [Thermostaphylospora chromogena]SDQ42661.1 Uncharacterized conserved protein YukE [Thermostaphylospora chromogena]
MSNDDERGFWDGVGARWKFITAAAMVGTASYWIPTLRPIPGFIALMAGDPEAMRSAARQWAPSSNDDGDGNGEIAAIRATLGNRTENINDYWGGSSQTTFVSQVDTYRRQLEEFDNQRTNMSSALHGSANLYDGVAGFCMAIGGMALALKAASLLARTPKGAFLQVALNEIGVAASKAVERVAGMQTKFVLKASGVLALLATGYGSFSSRLPGMDQAITFQDPQFTSARIAYNDGTGVTPEPPDMSDFEPPSTFHFKI